TFSTNVDDVFGCTNPAATNYDVTATLDDLSCVLPCTVSLSLDNVTSPSCNGENDALIQVLASGAQGSDDYYLDAIEGTAQNFGNFGSLVSGMYTVYVVDAAGCTDSLDVEVPVTEVVEVNAVLTSGVSCFDTEDAVLTIIETTGGSGMYEYYISNNPTVFTTQTEWTGLAGGQTLSIYAMDSNGCFGQSDAVAISTPTEINVGFQSNASVVDATCANTPDGEIYLQAFGGAAPSTIQYSVDGENYAPSPLMVTGGTYTVTAQDVNGCTATMEQEVVVGPAAIDVNAMSMPEACFGSADGQVSWAPEGGEGMYTYAFGGEATTETAVSDLAPGTYEVTVTDEDGCSETVSVEVAAGVEITATAVSTDASCFGDDDGEVELSAEGGTGSFQYSDDGNSFGQDNEFDDLLAGTYNFFVQDENGCVESVEATIGEPEAIVVTGIVSEGSVTGEGTIDVTVTGGSLPYTYEWIGPGVSGQDGQDLEGISTGSYTVDVTDDNGCTTQETFNITTDIRELGAGVTATVFPNPSQGEFVVDVQGGFQGAMDFLILDAQGRTIQAGQWTATSGAFRTTLDLSGAEAGVYRLVLMANGRPNSLQLVKTH
ncbi:MAG: T9SS type A sorting domain-containing protein, partial [Flavobacteriales bacterium]